MPLTPPERQFQKAMRLIKQSHELWINRDIAGLNTWAPEMEARKQEITDFLLTLGKEYKDIRDEVLNTNFLATDFMPELDEEGIPLDNEWQEIEVVNKKQVRRGLWLLFQAARRLKKTIGNSPQPIVQRITSSAGNVQASQRDPNRRSVLSKRAGHSGPKPRNHGRIVQIVNQYGEAWRDHLADICDNLDDARIPLSQRAKEKLKADRQLQTWAAASVQLEEQVIKTIEYSIRYLKKSPE